MIYPFAESTIGPSACLITIIHNRAHISLRWLLFNENVSLGKIINCQMQLSAMGQIADEHWRLIPDHFPHAELGAYVVMPNHVHGIIIIHDRSDASASERRGTIYRAPTEQFQKPAPGSIPTIIRTYKASVTRRIQKESNSMGIWQRNYHEHIIRNDEEYNRIHLYIEANVANWVMDNENLVKAT